ncbi:MAG: c-type cytochrome [Kiloniellales bacterium]
MQGSVGKLGALAGAVVLLAVAGFVGYQYYQAAVPRSGLTPSDPEVVALGEALYAEHCASCHGTELQGQPNWQQRLPSGRLPAPPHDASGHTWHHPDDQLFLLTKFGPADLVGGGYESDMPAYEGVLSDAEIRAVLSYIKSTWPPEIQARHDDINRRSHAAGQGH